MNKTKMLDVSTERWPGDGNEEEDDEEDDQHLAALDSWK